MPIACVLASYEILGFKTGEFIVILRPGSLRNALLCIIMLISHHVDKGERKMTKTSVPLKPFVGEGDATQENYKERPDEAFKQRERFHQIHN